jgi:hypothetical protein
MDKQVQLAMAKWPNVPDCYGWLALDARGAWRMRDQACQAQGLPGSKIGNTALRDFIARNYQSDATGRYFFQNGPQRVFVELEATPFIARFDPRSGWILHTGVVLGGCDGVWMTSAGNLIVRWKDYLAQIDDRDTEWAMRSVYMDEQIATDEQILAWLDQPDQTLSWRFDDRLLPICPVALVQLAHEHSFVQSPFSGQPAH